MKEPAVYIVCNKRNGTLYTGVTSNLTQRIEEHKSGLGEGFASKHGFNILVYFEFHERITDAIEREKQIKAGSRIDKLKLIESCNPKWLDLWDEII